MKVFHQKLTFGSNNMLNRPPWVPGKMTTSSNELIVRRPSEAAVGVRANIQPPIQKIIKTLEEKKSLAII